MTTLEQLPQRMDRLESQFLLLRAEMRDQFSATRAEADETRRTLREEIRAGDEETRRVLRAEIREVHVMIVTALAEQTEDTRRHATVLFEDAIARIAVIGEGLKALDHKVDTVHIGLSRAIDESRAETRAMFEQVFSRLDASTAPRIRARRSKKP